MLQRIRNRQKGFTLIELLIVIAIIGIIAALLIPNFLDALQKAKQKRTVADERAMVTAVVSLITDLSSAAAAGQTGTYSTADGGLNSIDPPELGDLLVTRYIPTVPVLDGWKNTYQYFMASELTAPQLFAVVSTGLKGVFDGPEYSITAFTPTDYEQDIVWSDQFPVHYPSNVRASKLRN